MSWSSLSIRAEINEMETKSTVYTINEKSWLFEKISKIDKFFAKVSKREDSNL
jgi:hypothetical protein